MSLLAPNLDDRRFQDLVDDAKRLVQERTDRWTDHNVSDPGVVCGVEPRDLPVPPLGVRGEAARGDQLEAHQCSPGEQRESAMAPDRHAGSGWRHQYGDRSGPGADPACGPEPAQHPLLRLVSRLSLDRRLPPPPEHGYSSGLRCARH